MSIYDRARDALKDSTPGPWKTSQAADEESTTWIEHDYFDVLHHDERGQGHLRENFAWMKRADAELTALAPELAAAVVRVAKLADELEGRAEGDEHSPAEQSAYRVAALELRAALEGVQE